MDETFETPVVDETSETTEPNFGKTLAKTLAVSTATSAGVIAGFMVVGLAIGKFQELKARRTKKLEDELWTPESEKN